MGSVDVVVRSHRFTFHPRVSQQTKVRLWCYRPETNNDKVYEVEVKKVGSRWKVVGHWGRRGHISQEQEKLSTSRKWEALQKAQRIVEQKVRKGYQVVDVVKDGVRV